MTAHNIDPKRLPRNVAIIMDGNGRWARKHGLSRARGHEAGAKSVRAVVEGCRELGGIESLSLYAFSTENWRRSKTEVNTLFRLLSKYVKLELDHLHREDIRIIVTGRREGLSQRVLEDVQHCMELTKNNKAMVLNLAINYGSRTELVDACRAIAEEAAAGRLNIGKINEDTISDHLYFPPAHDLDLLIRTSGERRVSNFMLWQLSYAEIVYTGTLWPDFRKRHLHRAIEEYQQRKRRFGGRK